MYIGVLACSCAVIRLNEFSVVAAVSFLHKWFDCQWLKCLECLLNKIFCCPLYYMIRFRIFYLAWQLFNIILREYFIGNIKIMLPVEIVSDKIYYKYNFTMSVHIVCHFIVDLFHVQLRNGITVEVNKYMYTSIFFYSFSHFSFTNLWSRIVGWNKHQSLSLETLEMIKTFKMKWKWLPNRLFRVISEIALPDFNNLRPDFKDIFIYKK